MAFGTCDTHKLPRLRNFEQAQRFFNTTKPLRGNGMEPNERPMHPDRGGAYKKFRVAEVQVDGHKAYDLVFYDTPCIRYFEPNPDGSRHVSIRYYNSVSTGLFIQHHGWGKTCPTFRTTDNKEALVPYAHRSGTEYPSAFLTFDANGLLIVERSWHVQFFKTLSSDEDKQRRKEFKQKLTSLFDVLYIQEHAIRDGVENLRGGWRWQEEGDAAEDLRKFVESNDPEYTLSPATIDTLLKSCSRKLWELASRAAYAEADKAFPSYNNWDERQQYRAEREPILVRTIDMKPVITGVRDDMLVKGGFMSQNKKIVLPMFMTEPIKGHFYRDAQADVRSERELLSMYKKV